MRKLKRALELNFKYFLLRREPTLVYSMKRTGLTALFSSLTSRGVLAIGTHHLDPQKLSTPMLSGSARWACRNIILKQKPAKVIALVRSPLENMLSTFARTVYGQQEAESSGTAGQTEPPNPDQLSEEFCRTYLETDRYMEQLEWFTDEFQKALGINVYEHAFDRQNGFCRFQEHPYDVLILRTEMSDEQKAEHVARLVGLPKLEMISPAAAPSNRTRLPAGKPGDETHYAAKYKALKQDLVIPQDFLDAIVDSPHVEHFFTPEERDAMRAKYGGAITTG